MAEGDLWSLKWSSLLVRDAGLGLFDQLSPTRHVGMHAIVMHMQQIAADLHSG